MKARLLKLFALQPEDHRPLLLLAPLFAVATASSVIIATFTKALFLSTHELAAIPWMFLGASFFTAVASVGYVSLMQRMELRSRFQRLLTMAVISFAILRLLYPLNEKGMSFVLFVWCTGVGHLVLIQMWNMSSGLLSARQGKRLFPVFAAVSTLGAAVGGGLVQIALMANVVTHDLIWLNCLLLSLPLFRVSSVVRELTGQLDVDVVTARRGAAGGLKTKLKGESEVSRGVRSILQAPLLSRLALFVFWMQIASVLLDYTFSGELKATLSKQELTGFLGRYYGLSNLVAFGFALFASSRMVRTVGIGLAVASSAIAVALGSLLYLAMSLQWIPGQAFWVIVGTSFFERITSFALSRNAIQMLVTPIDKRKGERAKTLIDGVVYRLATILVSVILLIVQPTAAQLWWLAPFAIAAATIVVLVALRIGPHYQRTLFEALRARRLDPSADPQTQSLVRQLALNEVRERFATQKDTELFKGLELLRELKLPIETQELLVHLDSTNSDVVSKTLATMNLLQRSPPKEVLMTLLHYEQDPRVLREVLRMLKAYPHTDLLGKVRTYATHDDAGVASLAMIWLKEVAGFKSTMDIQMHLANDIHSDDPWRRARAAKMAGRTQWVQQTHNLSGLIDDPDLSVRLNAVESMGQVGVVQYIDPLITALGRADLADRARVALARYGSTLVQDVAKRLTDGHWSLATQVRLLSVVESVADEAAMDLLRKCANSTATGLRNQAVASLWRMARDPNAPLMPSLWVRRQAIVELKQLQRYVVLRESVPASTPARRFFLREVDALRLQCEGRLFRLLGILMSRAALYRAFTNYRSSHKRIRSNAIELLDQQIRDPELRVFVDLLERGAAAAEISALDAGSTEVAVYIDKSDPWLQRVWTWTQSFGDSGEIISLSNKSEPMAQDPMEMVFLLKEVPLFAGLSGEQLLPVTDIVKPVQMELGDVVFQQGDTGERVFLVISGEVEVLHDEERVAVLREKECFGEMALLDQGERSASIRCLVDCDFWAISRQDFQDLLDLHPALAKGVIQVLTARLRDATELYGDAAESSSANAAA